MYLSEAIKNKYGDEVCIEKYIPISGGDINQAYTLELSDGSIVFMKTNSKENSDFFRTEAEGLCAIRQTRTVYP